MHHNHGHTIEDHGVEDHDRGLIYDLSVIEQQIASRRRALQFFGGASLATLIGACGGGGGSSSSSTGSTGGTATATPTATATASPTATATPTSTPTATAACVVDPTETNGPYPADGTNTSSGATSNVLITSGVQRSDIRSSFVGSSTTIAAGVLVTLKIRVVNTSNSCAGLAGYAVYLWQCDAQGRYSLYSSGITNESYLRGVQVTDANGEVTFTTIYPACYDGRWPHMHFEVFTSLAAATSGRAARLVGQFAMPAASNATVFNGDSRYSASIANYARVSLSSDNVFGDNSAAQLAQQTPTLTGSVTAGYTGTAVVGIAV